MSYNKDARTLLDKLVASLFSIARAGDRKVLLVAHTYYASGKVITPLLANGHQLLTRAKSNAVADLPSCKYSVDPWMRCRNYRTQSIFFIVTTVSSASDAPEPFASNAIADTPPPPFAQVFITITKQEHIQ